MPLRIRREQMQALSRSDIDQFLERARAHVLDYFADQCASLSDKALTAVLRHGFERADGYGLEVERDLLRYQTMMFIFGRDFDTNPELPWASRILQGSGSGAEKMNALQVEALRNRPQGQGLLAPLPTEG